MKISYVLPTRDRPERLAMTLDALGALHGHDGRAGPGARPCAAAEVIVVDNASRFPAVAPAKLLNGIPVAVIRRDSNEGAASRNAGAAAADIESEWVVMLDDDSYPADTGFLRTLAAAPADVAAVSADIYLPGRAQRESGGLPEVFIGCGVAIRRAVFLELGGYDAAFGYYAEEYDLAARMMRAGLRVVFDPWFRVEHHKVAQNRDMNLIVSRLARNNGWVMQRYAPEACRRERMREDRRRYRAIARKENALAGFAAGLAELRRTVRGQGRTPLSPGAFDRFTGLSYAREAVAAAVAEKRFATAAVVDEGKSAWAVHAALREAGARVVDAGRNGQESAEVLVIGTLSPGPMLDAYERRTFLMNGRGPRVIAPWVIPTRTSPRLGADLLTGGGAGGGRAVSLHRKIPA